MKISVITAVKNGEDFIRETVDSVLSQQGDFELEYIIRDGESTDKTLEILKEYENDSRITVISKKDGSPQEAINAGMAMATGEIGCWLNADDVFEPGTLQTVTDAFSKHSKLRWLYGRCRIIDEDGTEIRKPITLYKDLLGYVYSWNVLLCENFINQPATFWKMDLWRELDSLDPRHKAAWDYELWLKMAQKSRPLHIRKLFTSFRRHTSSISENHFERQFAEELAIARIYGSTIHHLIHQFNIWKIVFIYKTISRKRKLIYKDPIDHTFVIPAYGENPAIEACIISLLEQRIKSKIIITTSTPSPFLEDISKSYGLSLKINQEPSGIANDWNFALSNVLTRYATIAHQDDIYLPNYTEKMLSAAIKHANTGIVFCDYSELKDGQTRFWPPYLVVKRILLFPFYIKTQWKSKLVKLTILRLGCPICCPSVLYNMEKLKDFKFNPDYQINLDWDAWLRLASQQNSFTFVPQKLLLHRINSDTETYKAMCDSRRSDEDYKIFKRLWGNFIAKFLSKIYKSCYLKVN